MIEASAAAAAQDRAVDGYSGYEAWKRWESFFICDDALARYYAGECRDLTIAGGTVLEIGFGSGAFLAWAQERGANVVGAEINPAALDAARARHVEILPAAFETVADEHAGRFDAIVAFDVFEHLSKDDIRARLEAIAIMLKPGGKALLRFPNGQSPFGLAAQYGDPTHITPLSGDIVGAMIVDLPLEIERYGGAFLPGDANPVRTAVRWLRRAARKIVGSIVQLAYATGALLDPVVTLILRKPR